MAEYSNLRVQVRKVRGGDGVLVAVQVIVRNYADNTAMVVRVFPVLEPENDDVVYHEAFRWSHQLAGTLACDHQEVA